jgi:hypothetical protein
MTLRLLVALFPNLPAKARAFWVDRKFAGSKTPTVDLIWSGLLNQK